MHRGCGPVPVSFSKVHRGPRAGVPARKVHRGCGLISVFWKVHTGSRLQKSPWPLEPRCTSGKCIRGRDSVEKCTGGAGHHMEVHRGPGVACPKREKAKVHRGSRWQKCTGVRASYPGALSATLNPGALFQKCTGVRDRGKNRWNL